jgi:hypothetical protein
LALLALLLIDSGPAAADVVPLYERDHPGYDARGLKLGSFLLFPSFTDQLIYDDNIFARRRVRDDDFKNITSEAFALRSQWSRDNLNVRLFSDQELYASHPTENANTYGANISGKFDITRQSFFQVEGSLVQQPLGRGTPESDANSRERALYNTAAASAAFVQRLNHWVNRASASVQQIAYISERNAGRSYTRHDYTDRLGYSLSGQLSVFLQGSYADEDWLRQSDQRNADYWTGHLGISFEIPAIVQGEIGVGVVRHNYFHNPANPLTTPSFNGQLTWNILPLTSILAAANRTIIGTERFCDANPNGCATPGGQWNTREASMVEFGVQHEFWHDLWGEARFRYSRDHFDDNDLIDTTHALTANVRYSVNHNLELDLDYAYRARTANHPNDMSHNSGPYYENVVTLTLKAAL